MNSRSCDVMSSAPGSDFRKPSSQMIDSMSRWLVGSSISRTSGRPSSTRAIATRIFQPPESAPTSPSIALVVEAEAVQHLARLRLEAVAAEVVVFLLHLAEAREDAVHVAGLRRIAHRVLQRLELVVQIAEAAAAGDRFVEHRAAGHLLDVLPEVADRSASSAPTRRLRRAASSPTIIRNSVVLPEPFGPTRPTFSPGFSWNEASTKRICLPYCLLMREKEIIRPPAHPGRRARPGRRP